MECETAEQSCTPLRQLADVFGFSLFSLAAAPAVEAAAVRYQSALDFGWLDLF